jgi:hypothetical protein
MRKRPLVQVTSVINGVIVLGICYAAEQSFSPGVRLCRCGGMLNARKNRDPIQYAFLDRNSFYVLLTGNSNSLPYGRLNNKLVLALKCGKSLTHIRNLR